VIFANDQAMKTAGGDTACVHDQTVVTIAGNTDHTRHAPIFPLARHATDRFERIRVMAVVDHHVTTVQAIEIHAAGVVAVTAEGFQAAGDHLTRHILRTTCGDRREQVRDLKLGEAVHGRGD